MKSLPNCAGLSEKNTLPFFWMIGISPGVTWAPLMKLA